MNITEMIEQKRKELGEATAEQKKLWATVQEAEEVKCRAQQPWHDAYTRQNTLQHELAALEAIAKELEPAAKA